MRLRRFPPRRARGGFSCPPGAENPGAAFPDKRLCRLPGSLGIAAKPRRISAWDLPGNRVCSGTRDLPEKISGHFPGQTHKIIKEEQGREPRPAEFRISADGQTAGRASRSIASGVRRAVKSAFRGGKYFSRNKRRRVRRRRITGARRKARPSRFFGSLYRWCQVWNNF